MLRAHHVFSIHVTLYHSLHVPDLDLQDMRLGGNIVQHALRLDQL